MKGKNTFTFAEISELRNLIKLRSKTEPSKQKTIRAKMRKIGLYGSDDFGIVDLQPADFERLISSGRIKIIGAQKTPPSIVIEKVKESVPKEPAKKEVQKPIRQVTAKAELSDFQLFDPSKHTSDIIPDSPGNYIICLKKGSKLPEIGMPCVMKSFRNLEVIYTGIAGKSLRKRDYKQHFTGNNAGSSTLRKSLGSLFGYSKIARDKNAESGKTKFKEADEIKLSAWMASNLVLYYLPYSNPDILENKLIADLNPPLNLSKNSNPINSNFRSRLSALRSAK